MCDKFCGLNDVVFMCLRLCLNLLLIIFLVMLKYCNIFKIEFIILIVVFNVFVGVSLRNNGLN